MAFPQVDAAVAILYNPRSPADQRAQATAWLEQFQGTEDAWRLADAYLELDPAQSADAQYRLFFGANVMARKLARDFAQLPPAILPGLETTLVRHIGRLNELARTNPAVAGSVKPCLRQLCVAYADLLLQNQASDPTASLSQLLVSFPPPNGTLALLEILRAIPEETANKSLPVDVRRRRQYSGQLAAVGPQALNLLHGLLQASSASADEASVKAAFGAFGSWVACLNIPAQTAADSPMLQATVEALIRYPALFDAACSALQDVVSTYRRPESDAPLLQKLMPGLLQLEAVYDRSAGEGEDGEDACLALARLFADAGTTYVDYLCHPRPSPDPAVDAQRVSLVRILIKCASHSSMSVSGATFRFWDAVAESLQELASDHSQKAAVAFAGHGNPQALSVAWRLHVVQSLNPLMSDLAQVMLARLRFPDAAEWNDPAEWTADRKDHFRHRYRYKCSDALHLACEVSGYEPILALFAGRLQGELGTWSAAIQAGAKPSDGWSGVESCLYAIRAIARYVKDGGGPVLSGVFSLLSQLPPVEELRATCFRLIGRYSSWLRKNGTYLRPAMQMLLQHGLGLAPAQAGAAAAPATTPVLPSPATECACRALTDLSQGAGSDSDPSVYANAGLVRDELLSVANRVPIAALHHRNANHILSALANAVGSLTPPGMPHVPAGRESPDHATCVMAIAGPILARLKQFNEDPNGALQAAAADGLLLSCMATMDGEVDSRACGEAGVDTSTAAALLAAAKAQGGSIVPQLRSITRPERAAAACVHSLVIKLCSFLGSLKPDAVQILDIAGLNVPPADRRAYDELKSKEAEVKAAAERGLTAAMLALQSAAWPVLSQVVQIYGPGGPISAAAGESTCVAIVFEVEGVWHYGLDVAGPAMLPLLQALVGTLQPLMNGPAGGGAPSSAWLRLTTTLMRDTSHLMDSDQWAGAGGAGASPHAAAVGELMTAYAALVNAATTAVSNAFNAALAAPAAGAAGAGGAAAGGRAAAPWSGMVGTLIPFFGMLMAGFRHLGDKPEVAQAFVCGLQIATSVVGVYHPELTREALFYINESAALVDPRTGRGMLPYVAAGDAMAAALAGPGAMQHIVQVLAQCLASPAHEPVISNLDRGGGGGDSVAEALRELAVIAPEVVAGALDAALSNGAIVPPDARPSDAQKAAAYDLMFPAMMQQAQAAAAGPGHLGGAGAGAAGGHHIAADSMARLRAALADTQGGAAAAAAAAGGFRPVGVLDKVGDRQRFQAGVKRLSYAGVKGRLDEGSDRDRDGYVFRGGLLGDGDSETGDNGSDDEEDDGDGGAY